MSESRSTPRKVAFVTGASYGIGEACALALARDGFAVAVSATCIENVDSTCEKLHALGVQALPVALDVRDHDAVHAAFERIVDTLGEVDVLVNNAGITLQKAIVDVTSREWADVIDTNLTGAFYTSQALAQRLIARGGAGAIVNVASTHGIVAYPQRSAYGISKAAMIHMTKMMALEWAKHRIRVNAVAPGRADTPSPSRAKSAADPRYLEAAMARIPLGRFCTADDVAEAVRYLASPQASYVTGHTLVLDGGVTIA